MTKYIRMFILSFSLLCCLSAYAVGDKLNINTADAITLSSELVGVGESKAVAIVEYREQNGPFASVDDLLQVKGIGNNTLEKNRSSLSTE